MESFRIAVPDAVLHDLDRRLAAWLAPPHPIDGGGEDPATMAEIDRLIGYWRDGFDWRAQEERLNQLPQFRTTVDGVGLHFVHVRGAGTDPRPLLLTNGWPSSFAEYAEVFVPLAEAGFTVVAPAIPGFGFSDPCLDRRPDRVWVAGLFDRLMVEELGYPRYLAHGDDIGGGIVNRLAMRHSQTVAAIQCANWLVPPRAADSTAEEILYYEGDQVWKHDHGAYAHVQATRPHTLAIALHDSPAGLAAWILEKWLTWSDPATRGRLSDDLLLTNVMIYWASATIGSSVRLYALTTPVLPGDTVPGPATVLIPREPDLPVPPEALLRRAYPGLTRIRRVDAGGHFLAAEAPDTFVAEIIAAFR